MGPASRGEKVVLTVFALTVFWVFREPLTNIAPILGGLNDTNIAIIAAAVLFAIPVDWRNGVFALDWQTAVGLPWGLLLLFGGGLSLANAVQQTGVDAWFGSLVSGLDWVPIVVLVLTVTATVILLTEMTSNTATAAALLPILAGAAVGLNFSPLVLVIPAALAAACAFMIPVATPPNAIVFGSGHVTIVQMVRAGVWLNIIGIFLVTLTALTLASWIFGVSFSG